MYSPHQHYAQLLGIYLCFVHIIITHFEINPSLINQALISNFWY